MSAGGEMQDLSGQLCGYCSCAGKPVINGPSDCTEQELGTTFTCSTWEHDYCCACIPLDRRPTWFCFGPHVSSCDPASYCGANHPIDGRSCQPCESGHRFACPIVGPQLCCDCLSDGKGYRWTCRTTFTGGCDNPPSVDAGDCDAG